MISKNIYRKVWRYILPHEKSYVRLRHAFFFSFFFERKSNSIVLSTFIGILIQKFWWKRIIFRKVLVSKVQKIFQEPVIPNSSKYLQLKFGTNFHFNFVSNNVFIPLFLPFFHYVLKNKIESHLSWWIYGNLS